jgi:PD-(D/E)XK nuclease superfamily
MNINDLTGEIIGAAIEVHRTLGPGLWNLFMRNAFAVNLT